MPFCNGCAARGKEGEVRKRDAKFEEAFEARSWLRSSKRGSKEFEGSREGDVDARRCRDEAEMM
jgi:hypothetical protein